MGHEAILNAWFLPNCGIFRRCSISINEGRGDGGIVCRRPVVVDFREHRSFSDPETSPTISLSRYRSQGIQDVWANVTLFWSRRAPNTSPLEVTPGCTLSSSTTFRVCSGICRTCISPKGFPMLASVVFTWETSNARHVHYFSGRTDGHAKSSVPGVFTSSLTSLRVMVANPAFSAVTLYVPGAIWRNLYSPLASVTFWRSKPLSA